MHMLICMQSTEVGSDRKWSLEMNVETRVNARSELMDSELSNCNQIPQDGDDYQV